MRPFASQLRLSICFLLSVICHLHPPMHRLAADVFAPCKKDCPPNCTFPLPVSERMQLLYQKGSLNDSKSSCALAESGSLQG